MGLVRKLRLDRVAKWVAKPFRLASAVEYLKKQKPEVNRLQEEARTCKEQSVGEEFYEVFGGAKLLARRRAKLDAGLYGYMAKSKKAEVIEKARKIAGKKPRRNL